jgi:hypothetical protein
MFKETKFDVCKTLVRPVLIKGSESWPLERKEENMLRIFERRMLIRIQTPWLLCKF